MTRSPLRLSVTGRQTRITVEHVPCSLDGSRAAFTRFLHSWIAARFPRVVIAHQSKRRVFPNWFRAAPGCSHFCAPHHLLQEPRGRAADRFHALLRLLFHVPKHGADEGAKTRISLGEVRNVMR